MDNNNNQFNNQQHDHNEETTPTPEPRKRRGGLTLTKVAVTAAVAGLLGGGVAYGGINYFNNSGMNDTAVPAGSNSTGNTKTCLLYTSPSPRDTR